MAAEFLDSPTLTGLLTQPLLYPTAGEGTSGVPKVITDTVTVTAVGMATIGSTYRLCRFPAYAKIKELVVDLGIVDSGGATAVFDINVAWSDSPYDGTSSLYQGSATAALAIPKTGQLGTTTSQAAYSSPNKLFGSITAANNANKLSNVQTFAGTYAAGGASAPPNVAWFPFGRDLPLWEFLGFGNVAATGLSTLSEPNGFFDLYFYLATAATTGAAGTITARLTYVV